MSRIQGELDCDEVVRNFPGFPRPHVQVFSHMKPEVPDIPDRLYTVRGVDAWWEVKVGRDKLTKGQSDFLERRYQAGGIAGVGDADALRHMIYSMVPSLWREYARGLVLEQRKRGFRDETKAESDERRANEREVPGVGRPL